MAFMKIEFNYPRQVCDCPLKNILTQSVIFGIHESVNKP